MCTDVLMLKFKVYNRYTQATVWLRTPDDGQKGCPKHVRVVIPIKLEFSASIGFIHKESILTLTNSEPASSLYSP